MLQVVTLYLVQEKALPAFVAAVRSGTWHALARQLQPDLIATDLLQRQGGQYLMCIDFWTSPEAYTVARNSPSFEALFVFRRNLAQRCYDLGAFTHPGVAATVFITEASVHHP